MLIMRKGMVHKQRLMHIIALHEFNEQSRQTILDVNAYYDELEKEEIKIEDDAKEIS